MLYQEEKQQKELLQAEKESLERKKNKQYAEIRDQEERLKV